MHRALVRLVAAFVPVLQRAEGGVIINMTSQMGKPRQANQPVR